jgi:hypothetical protein
MNVTIIQYLLLLDFPILPVDSNVESSNIASLESGVCYSYLDTAGTANVPVHENRPYRSVITLSEQCPACKTCYKNSAIAGTRILYLPSLQLLSELVRPRKSLLANGCRTLPLRATPPAAKLARVLPPVTELPCPGFHAIAATQPALAQLLQLMNRYRSGYPPQGQMKSL